VSSRLEERPPIRVRGRVLRQPRDVGFFSDASRGYAYSQTVAPAIALGPAVADLLAWVNTEFDARYNGVLVNRYRGGDDCIADHSDAERALDPTAGVVVLSAGATRTMVFKCRDDAPVGALRFRRRGGHAVDLHDGSVVQMRGRDFQRSYTHGIPRRAHVDGVRVSFTFRVHADDDREIDAALSRKRALDTIVACTK
jgi:alkylated DNA repair dioxygenase AlkB